jgi:hypothetical protein
MTLETAFADLLGCLAANDSAGVQNAISKLGTIHNELDQVPDHVVERLLALLRSQRMCDSPLAGHVFNFFEFESSAISSRAKSMCRGFLDAHGDAFTHSHSRQVVTELRYGPYLK